MGAAEDQSKSQRAKTITDSLTALLKPIIAKAVEEAGTPDPDPIIEITREEWPLRPILEAVRRGELGGVSRIGRRYYARRSVVYGFVETHQIRVRRRAVEAAPALRPAGDDLDDMMADLYSRPRRK